MPCDSYVPKNTTPVQRKKQIEEAVERLNKAIAAGQVTLVVDRATGAVGFKGESGLKSNGVSDACAFRKLQLSGSFAFKQALQKAEMQVGRKINEKAIDAGVHMHGSEFFPGHGHGHK
jgi:hypothetical protein